MSRRRKRPALLTEELVLAKARAHSLEQVKNLNLWGCWLSDVSILAQASQAEVLSLSVNRVASLLPFSFCNNLAELYMRRNNVEDLVEIGYLRKLPLRILWLVDNPCSKHRLYRPFVLRLLPGIQKLDNTDVTEADRDAAEAWEDPELDSLLERARALPAPGDVDPVKLHDDAVAAFREREAEEAKAMEAEDGGDGGAEEAKQGEEGAPASAAKSRRGGEAGAGHSGPYSSPSARSGVLSHTATGRRRGDMVPRAVLLLLEDLSVAELSLVSKRCAELIAEAEEVERE